MTASFLLSTAVGTEAAEGIEVLELEGKALLSRAGDAMWREGIVGDVLREGDRLRVMERSRAVVRLSDRSMLRLGELSLIQIPVEASRRGGVHLLRGILYYFHRERPGTMPLSTPSAHAVVRGTEFTAQVDDAGATRLAVLDGEVSMANARGTLVLRNGEAGAAALGQAPAKVPVLDLPGEVRWAAYYPGVLDVEDLRRPAETLNRLGAAVDAYRTGDLLGALAAVPDGFESASDSERLFLAALLLAAGNVGAAETLLAAVARVGSASGTELRIAAALERFVAVVLGQSGQAGGAAPLRNTTATEWLVTSYQRQLDGDLTGALEAAREARERSALFAYAWARVGEMEFSFGRWRAAREAVARSLELAPRNAQAIALEGFALLAGNRVSAASDRFDAAISVNGALGNAWLGRGLCRIRSGDTDTGRQALQVAVTLEPTRAVLRSYLAKALSEGRDLERAGAELDLALHSDPREPTPWFYRALLRQRRNRINAAVRDLERSKRLNGNRRMFRSTLLLEQDRAVRSANLAAQYGEAGMEDFGVREAANAVGNDYGNPSAHLFLANSFNALRDPTLTTLRYETVAVSEYLLANLLAPVGGTRLSSRVSQQEYLQLFERDRPGLQSESVYASDGSWSQAGSLHGVAGGVGYAVDGAYRSRRGYRVNNDLDQWLASAQTKLQWTPEDSVYVLAAYGRSRSGDVRPHYFDEEASAGLRLEERQEPAVLAGYHREWTPGVHTLLLGSHLNSVARVEEPNALVRTLVREADGNLTGQVAASDSVFDLDYASELEIWSVEGQQLIQQPRFFVLAGVRYQAGDVDTRNVLGRDPFLFPPVYTDPAVMERLRQEIERWAVYGYGHWDLTDSFRVIGGLAYDWLRFPEGTDAPPITDHERTQARVSPKAGLRWTPEERTTVRAIYTRSLGGLSYENSARLEPTQLAGFAQTYRSLIPESKTGTMPGARYETVHFGVEHRFAADSFLVLAAEWLRSDAERVVGLFDFTDAPPFVAVASGTRQEVAFEERSFSAALTQLLGERWSMGLRYRVSEATLAAALQGIPEAIEPRVRERSILHQGDAVVRYRHESGFYLRGEGLWRAQRQLDSAGTVPTPESDIWQFNLWAGWTFASRRVDLAMGVLNLTDRTAPFNPLNPASELPRDRTVVMTARFSF